MKSFIRGMLILAVCTAVFGCSGNQGTTNSNLATNGSSANSNAVGGDAPASGERVPYPQAVADEFLKSCTKAGSDAKFCACIFEKIQSKYSFEEFSVIESKIIAGKAPDEFVEFSGKARAACTSR